MLAVRSGGPLSDPVLWATNWMWVPAQVGVLLVLLRFPSGRLPGRRWRVIEVVVLAWGVACVATTAVLPGPVGLTVLEHLQNPYGWTAAGPVLHALLSPLFLLLPLLTVASAAAPVLRWRRAGGHARQQLRWVAAAAALTVVAAPLVLLGTDSAADPLSLATLLLPTAIACSWPGWRRCSGRCLSSRSWRRHATVMRPSRSRNGWSSTWQSWIWTCRAGTVRG